MVMALSAFQGEIFCASPRVFPLRVRRFTAAQASRIMSGGTTGGSL